MTKQTIKVGYIDNIGPDGVHYTQRVTIDKAWQPYINERISEIYSGMLVIPNMNYMTTTYLVGVENEVNYVSITTSEAIKEILRLEGLEIPKSWKDTKNTEIVFK